MRQQNPIPRSCIQIAGRNALTVAPSGDNSRRGISRNSDETQFAGQRDWKHPVLLPRGKSLSSKPASKEESAPLSRHNRCFAYMNLGQLQKALDDCTMSLKYDRLPDAFHKE
jgi:hypothetical protein